MTPGDEKMRIEREEANLGGPRAEGLKASGRHPSTLDSEGTRRLLAESLGMEYSVAAPGLQD